MTSSQGVVKHLSSGTLTRPSLDTATTSDPPALTQKPSTESLFTRGFRRNKVKTPTGEKIEDGKVKTWEWKGSVYNQGITVGGCDTEVLVINVSVPYCLSGHYMTVPDRISSSSA